MSVTGSKAEPPKNDPQKSFLHTCMILRVGLLKMEDPITSFDVVVDVFATEDRLRV